MCGVHSKNHVPLPHLGIMHEVRVCDICLRQLVQRRAGYRSPKRRSQVGRGSFIQHDGDDNSDDAATSSLMSEKLPSPSVFNGMPPLSTASSASCNSIAAARLLRASSSSSQSGTAAAESFIDPMCGVIYSCLLEEQDNMVDEILYLGTFTMGGRSLASRRMSANVAIWKDRMFMLTSAEMLTFKTTSTDKDTSTAALVNMTALGEVRSTVHLTDILHMEVNEQYPRILTVIRADGRVFRVRAKTPEQCEEIAAALRKTMAKFQDAMHRLQRGPQPEDNVVSCVTIQHESSLPEQVVVPAPLLEQPFDVDMYPSSILRLYVNGPDATGMAQFSCEMLKTGRGTPRKLEVQAEQLVSALCEQPQALHVSVGAEPIKGSSLEKNQRSFWCLIAILVAGASIMQLLGIKYIELVTWLFALILVLTRFHEPLSLWIATKRLHRAQRFRVSCTEIRLGKNSESETGDASDELVSEQELDNRFLEGCNGDVEEAKWRYSETLRWRKENNMDTILLTPKPQFANMKASLPHWTHKKDRLGHPVTYEFLGEQRKSYEAFLARGVTEEEAKWHHIVMQEYLWKVIDPRPFPDGTQIKIYDIKGISMSDISGGVFNYTKDLGETVALYNPERIFQVFIINPPAWFNLIWKLISPLINPKTRERVHVLRGQKEITKALLEFIEPENLPVEYGGKCACEGGCSQNSPEEKDLREWVDLLNTNIEGESAEDRSARIKEAFDELCAKYQAQIERETADRRPVLLSEQ